MTPEEFMRKGQAAQKAVDAEIEPQRKLDDHDIVIRLSREEKDLLLLALGCAAGAAMERKENQLARSFFHVINAVARNIPGMLPYEVETK